MVWLQRPMSWPIAVLKCDRTGSRVKCLHDRAGLTQRRYLALTETALRQDLICMLSEQRCAPADVGRRGAHLDRRAERSEVTERGMLDLDNHVARVDLRIGEHLRVIVDRPARDVVLFKEGQPERS